MWKLYKAVRSHSMRIYIYIFTDLFHFFRTALYLTNINQNGSTLFTSSVRLELYRCKFPSIKKLFCSTVRIIHFLLIWNIYSWPIGYKNSNTRWEKYLQNYSVNSTIVWRDISLDVEASIWQISLLYTQACKIHVLWLCFPIYLKYLFICVVFYALKTENGLPSYQNITDCNK